MEVSVLAREVIHPAFHEVLTENQRNIVLGKQR